MRVCRRQGWTIEFFSSLSEGEQVDWLADDLLRQELIDNVLSHVSEAKYAEVSTLLLTNLIVLLEKL